MTDDPPITPNDDDIEPPKKNAKGGFIRKFVKYEESEEDRRERRELTQIVEDGGFDPGIDKRLPTKHEKFVVRCMVFAGIPQPRIAATLRVSDATLKRLFQHELDHGTDMMVTDIAVASAQRAKAGSDTMSIFLLKTRGRGAFKEDRGTGGEDLAEAASQLGVDDKKILVQKILDGLKPKAAEEI